jgi:hypothetical protein
VFKDKRNKHIKKVCEDSLLLKLIVRIILERTFEIGEKLCVCFIDWQEEFECVKLTKLMKMIKEAGTSWHKKQIDQQTVRGSEC